MSCQIFKPAHVFSGNWKVTLKLVAQKPMERRRQERATQQRGCSLKKFTILRNIATSFLEWKNLRISFASLRDSLVVFENTLKSVMSKYYKRNPKRLMKINRTFSKASLFVAVFNMTGWNSNQKSYKTCRFHKGKYDSEDECC